MATVTATRVRRLMLTGVLAAGLGAGAAGVASAATNGTAGTTNQSSVSGHAATTAHSNGAKPSASMPAKPRSKVHHCPGM